MKLVVIAVVLLVAGGAGYYVWTMPAAAELPAAQPVPPPADARYLEELFGSSVGPEVVVRECLGDPAVLGAVRGMWLDSRGWNGEVLGVDEQADVMRISLQADHISVPGQISVICSIPGWVDVQRGGWAKVQGRIADVVPSPDALVQPTKIMLEDVTVLASRPPR